jgi:hypothetical protein
VYRLSHSLVVEVASLRFKFDNQNISEFDYIKISEISTQVVNIFSNFHQNKKII